MGQLHDLSQALKVGTDQSLMVEGMLKAYYELQSVRTPPRGQNQDENHL